MSFIENITKKVAQTAKSAAKKSGEIVEVTKLNINIASEEEKIEKLFVEIGQCIYQQYLDNMDVDDCFKQHVSQIDELRKNIDDIKKKIMQVKNSKTCNNCNCEISNTAIYCFNCGKKQEIIETTVINNEYLNEK